MALNIQTLKTRSLTAAVFVVIMLAGLLLNQWSFFILFSIIHFGCWIEFQKLVTLIDPDYATISPFHRYSVMVAGWCLLLFVTDDTYRIGSLPLNSIGWWMVLISIFMLPLIELLFSRELSVKNIGYSMIGLGYISLSWAMMVSLRNPQSIFMLIPYHPLNGRIIPLLIISSIWINDTMAYIVGSLIGRTPFSSISPKKTWEGTAGGAVLCIVVVTLCFQTLVPWRYLLVVSTICAVVGTAGDLLESKLKRMAGVKDSGQIMPGHGGFLDRFDSLLLATPFIWLFLRVAAS